MPRVPHAAPPISGDVVRMIVNLTTDGEQQQWSLDYMASGFSTSPQGDMILLQAAFVTAYKGGIIATIDSTVTFASTTAVFMSRNDISTSIVAVTGGAGTVGASHLDKQLAATIQKLTSLKGAHGRGRMLWGPIPVTFVAPLVDPNRLTTTAQTLYGTLATTMVNTLTPGGGTVSWTPCVSTRPITGGGNVVTNAAIINRMTANLVVGTAKRRRVGRGI